MAPKATLIVNRVRLDKLNLAKLLHLNISYNLFADSNSIEKCVIGLPKLQVLDFTNNPIMNVKGYVPNRT